MNPWKRRCLFKNRPIIFSFQFPPVASFCFQKSRNQPCQQNMTIINRFHHESTEGTHWSIEVLRVVRTHGCHWRSSSIGIGIFLETKHGEALAECCKVNVVEKKTTCFSMNIEYCVYMDIIRTYFSDLWTHHCIKTTKKTEWFLWKFNIFLVYLGPGPILSPYGSTTVACMFLEVLFRQDLFEKFGDFIRSPEREPLTKIQRP